MRSTTVHRLGVVSNFWEQYSALKSSQIQALGGGGGGGSDPQYNRIWSGYDLFHVKYCKLHILNL
jgi:hypothetical protein